MKKNSIFLIILVSLLTSISCGNDNENTNNSQQNNIISTEKKSSTKTSINSTLNPENQKIATNKKEVKDTIQKENNVKTNATSTASQKKEKPEPKTTESSTNTSITKEDENETTVMNIEEELTSSSTVKEESKEYNPETFNHDIWDNLLRKHVTAAGKVNYKGFKADKSQLEEYIKQLQAEYKGLSSSSKNKQLAYWINLYNAYTVKLIVDNYPVKSIKDINGGNPWSKKFIFLGGKSYTLNNIENDIIRPRYKERRIHFAVNCAAVSCPKLLNQAYTESNLMSKLTQQTKYFLANSSKNQLDKKKVKISKIFDWYKVDFTKSGTVIPFIQQYSKVEINDNAKIEYLPYNWDLND